MPLNSIRITPQPTRDACRLLIHRVMGWVGCVIIFVAGVGRVSEAQFTVKHSHGLQNSDELKCAIPNPNL